MYCSKITLGLKSVNISYIEIPTLFSLSININEYSDILEIPYLFTWALKALSNANGLLNVDLHTMHTKK